MSVFVVPPPEPQGEEWPTLGPAVWGWMLDNLVYGPGDLRGTPLYEMPPDNEFRAWLYRLYEVYPRDHPNAGRRRFKRAAISVRKGAAKTEKAAWIAAGELAPTAPVRCIGWTLERGEYVPVGGPVQDPYVPMVAYTEEQSEELAYGALKVIVEESDLIRDLDPGVERIARRVGQGKAVALATAPDARDGARTTFQHFDETHRLRLPRQVAAHQTMLANIPKRRIADAWSLETTTTYAPGEGSVAEGTHEYAQLVAQGKVKNPSLFYFHRQASDHHDLDTEAGLRDAVIEASGPAAEWSDVDYIVGLAQDPQTDRNYWRRVWLNQPVAPEGKAFDLPGLRVERDAGLPPDGTLVAIGFDGSKTRDATALVGTVIEDGYQFLFGLWERPPSADEWEVPVDEVDQAVDEAFRRWDVWRLYADPYYWDTQVAEWQGRHGAIKGGGRRARGVVPWPTNTHKRMALSLAAYAGALRAGEARIGGATPDLADAFRAHLGNAYKTELNIFDDRGNPLWLLRKERDDSPFKIDAAMAGALSWEARRDAVAAGVVKRRSRRPVSIT